MAMYKKIEVQVGKRWLSLFRTEWKNLSEDKLEEKIDDTNRRLNLILRAQARPSRGIPALVEELTTIAKIRWDRQYPTSIGAQMGFNRDKRSDHELLLVRSKLLQKIEITEDSFEEYLGTGRGVKNRGGGQLNWSHVVEHYLTGELKILRELKKKSRQKRIASVAAAYEGKVRSSAGSVKRKLDITDNCPYCDRPLGNDYQADHIYPVSKGGLSTSENMVNICKDCNRRKRRLTLREFIMKYGYNRSRIEKVLGNLGKDF